MTGFSLHAVKYAVSDQSQRALMASWRESRGRVENTRDMTEISLHGSRVALVTGASRGIGREVALLLAERQYRVAVHFRAARDEADRVVEDIRQRGAHAEAIQADLAVDAEAATLVERVENALGPLSVLVNNAGITRDRLLLQMSVEDWDATWCTDLAGARAVARAALRSMYARGYGRIVNVSSVVGATGNAGQANYAAAKSAIFGLTRELAVMAGPSGVTVNCVTPGYITTDATAHLTERQREAWFAQIPMGRAATARDVAELVVFLTGDSAAYITGQCIAVDGGLLAAAGRSLA
jgi:3-oxoacyl-[acyl-carrier protein] reductase